MRQEFDTTKEAVKRLPIDMKNAFSVNELVDQANVTTMMKNISTEHTLSNERMKMMKMILDLFSFLFFWLLYKTGVFFFDTNFLCLYIFLLKIKSFF